MNKIYKSKPLYIILILVLFTLVACADEGSGNKDDGIGDDADNNSGVETIKSGLWSGNANFGEVEFEVSSDSTGIESFEVLFSDYTCGIVTHNESIELIFNPKRAIVNRHIEINITLGGFQSNDSIEIEGTFEQAGDYISGEFEIENEGTVCSGSWSAQPI